MNEVTVSAVLMVPPIRGGQQRIKGLVPAMWLQQLRLQGNEYGQPHGEVPARADPSVRVTEANLPVLTS
jgi:hypothetical protein